MILQGNSLEILKTLESESINCCVTSPPYFGLREYHTEPFIWDAEINCDHEWKLEITKRPNNSGGSSKKTRIKGVANFQHWVDYHNRTSVSDFCIKCGAWKGSLGLEPTPELYIKHLCAIFEEVKRVLKKDGTLWLNLGDSYNAGRNGGHAGGQKQGIRECYVQRSGANVPGLKPKDLIGIPWMVDFALRNCGWYLRQDIIWHKPNSMVESVMDRCTKSHEYMFLFSKSYRYYFDFESIKEPSVDLKTTRNKRSVWSVNTKPFKGAHFATFPEKLIEPCILAGSPKNGIVLDIFMGAGTTALVAKKNGRNYLGIELNPNYIKIAEDRIKEILW